MFTSVKQNIPTNNIIPILPERACGECAKCCEGWLFGQAHGHTFLPGKPCHFLEKTCTIYDSRPYDPCQTYKCAWLTDPTFPAWMKPSLSNVIITRRTYGENNTPYYEVMEAGATMAPEVLNWLLVWSANNGINIRYSIKGGSNWFGSQEFINVKP